MGLGPFHFLHACELIFFHLYGAARAALQNKEPGAK